VSAGASKKLIVNGLNAAYGRAHILHDVSLDVAAGEVVALVGRNGAGKSTTLRAILGLVESCEGDIVLDRMPLSHLPVYERVRRGLGYVPEDRRIFSDLTADENLEVGRRSARRGAPEWTRERLLDIFPNLRELRSRRGGQMSGGEQQMLAIARTLMGNPSLLLLDEPSEGLAPTIVERMIEAILTMKRQGLSLLLSEQNVRFAGLVADRTCVIEKGRVRFFGTTAEFDARSDIRNAYLAL
jgi:branched-chain amino acid transport system ATP-binding protein